MHNWQRGHLVVTIATLVLLSMSRPSPAQVPTPCVLNGDGSGLHRLPHSEAFGWLECPRWSPDGRSIAYNAQPKIATANRDAHILKQAADGSGEPQDLGLGRMPTWSPDGKQIAFFVPDGNSDGLRHGVWSMNADGSGRTQMFNGKMPYYSPDGGQIAYINGGVIVYDILNGKSKKITGEPYQAATNVAWSPDGRRLAFLCAKPGGAAVELVLLDRSQPEHPFSVRCAGVLSRVLNWAPGNKILVGVDVDGVIRPHLVDPDSTEPPQALGHEEPGNVNIDASWSPDGKRIVLISNRDE